MMEQWSFKGTGGLGEDITSGFLFANAIVFGRACFCLVKDVKSFDALNIFNMMFYKIRVQLVLVRANVL